MTASELVTQLQDIIARFPNAAHKEVKIFGPDGRAEFDEVSVSITENIWIIQK